MSKKSIKSNVATQKTHKPVLDRSTFESLLGLLVEHYNSTARPSLIKDAGAKPAMESALITISEGINRIADHGGFARSVADLRSVRG